MTRTRARRKLRPLPNLLDVGRKMLFRVIDFETTGMPTEDDRQAIVEIGWCDVIDGAVGDPKSLLVNPGRPIPPLASAVHDIMDADVEDAPPLDVALLRLTAYPHPDYWVAHNSKYEQEFFKGGDTPWICTYRAALRVWPELESHGNAELRYCLDLPANRRKASPAHRAGPDAYVTALILARILQERPTEDDLAAMVRWSKGPPLWFKMKFGKHKGLLMTDVPSSYYEWMLKQGDMDAEAKANAKYQLKQRGDL